MKKRSKKQTKTKAFLLRLTPDDYAQMKKDAERAGLPIAELARSRVLKRRAAA
jgi:hypothetical protein